eukprot:TRINITY_DN26835_c0_g1_i1.p1 TRINITY_DN26835_c0_g1~~TRINITY_DN26835_c0_g1_i1.p1  ORF type:complete len:548 (-),score=115.84 TRINITY_DN26835_c0_g1_i1:10-1653(-)
MLGCYLGLVAVCCTCCWSSLAAPPLAKEKQQDRLRPCDHEDESENLLRAYAFAKERHFDKALPCLERAAVHFPYVPRIFTDLGRAALRVAKRALKLEEGIERALELLQEACAAMWLAEILRDPGAQERRAQCQEFLLNVSRSSPEEHSSRSKDESCISVDGDSNGSRGMPKTFERLSQEISLLHKARLSRSNTGAKPDASTVAASAADLCGADQGRGARLEISATEIATGRLRPTSLLAAQVRLEVCGLLWLEPSADVGSVLDRALIEEASSAERARAVDIIRWRNQSSTEESKPLDAASAVERWKGRYEVKVPLAAPYTEPGLVANPLLLQLMRLSLGPRVEIDTFSAVTALSGAPEQPWHMDVDHLYKEPAAAGHQPATGFVMLLPLHDLTEEMGPTEFLLGSHVDVGDGAWDHFRKSLTRVSESASGILGEKKAALVRPLLSCGSLLLFDLRVYHRGAANSSPGPRSILYMSYVKDWFLDRLNFQNRQSVVFDSLPHKPQAPLQKLLRRVDANSYLEELQAFAAAHGGPQASSNKKLRESELSI